MKKLIIIRHAKSSWKSQVTDSKRPLKKRGIADAQKVFELLCLKINHIDYAYSSHAFRALETCKIFLNVFKFTDKKLQITEQLYDFGGLKFTDFIKSLPDKYKTVVVFGHNHAITAFVNTFGSEHIDNVPTSGIVIIEFETEKWLDINNGKTIYTLFPKDIR